MSKASRAQVGKVAISRGAFRGRMVRFLEHEGLRPTPSRVREAVFSMLADLAEEGYGFLDACAGSGVMGFTAAGCGFAPVVMVDGNKAVLDELEKNQKQLEVSVDLVYGSALQVGKLPMAAGPWICYADPPFDNRKFHPKMTARLVAHDAFAPGSLNVAEHEQPFTVAEGLTLLKQKKYGRTLISVYRKEPPAEDVAPVDAASAAPEEDIPADAS